MDAHQEQHKAMVVLSSWECDRSHHHCQVVFPSAACTQ